MSGDENLSLVEGAHLSRMMKESELQLAEQYKHFLVALFPLVYENVSMMSVTANLGSPVLLLSKLWSKRLELKRMAGGEGKFSARTNDPGGPPIFSSTITSEPQGCLLKKC
jgi:hypothetical protein